MRRIGKIFKRPDKGLCPIFEAPDGVYRIQDYKNKYCYHKDDGDSLYNYALVFRKKGRTKRKCSPKEFAKLRNRLELRYSDSIGSYELYEDKAKEYYYSKRDEKLIVQYMDVYIGFDFSSFRECLEYSEHYILSKYDISI